MRILYITTVGKTMSFFISLITELVEEGTKVDIAANQLGGESPFPEKFESLGCKEFDIDCVRKPLAVSNIKAIHQIGNIVNAGNYDIVHCHTPIAALCSRIACYRARKHGLKVIYTAHGFHFYKGAPLKNWIIYYPIEKLCAALTDVIITINYEDYQRATKRFKNTSVKYIPGVGIEYDRFNNAYAESFRNSLGLSDNDFILASVGEINKNKNHKVVIQALSKINDQSIHYVIAGTGSLQKELELLVSKYGLEKQVHFLGFRKDVHLLYSSADVCVFPSIREGQGIAAIEGMASGLPLIVSDNRGLRGIVSNENAIICKYNDSDAFANAILYLKNNRSVMETMRENNIRLSKRFDKRIINSKMKEIYYSVK